MRYEISALQGVTLDEPIELYGIKKLKKKVGKVASRVQQQAVRQVAQVRRRATGRIAKIKSKIPPKQIKRMKKAVKTMLKNKAVQDSLIIAACSAMGNPQIAMGIIQAKDALLGQGPMNRMVQQYLQTEDGQFLRELINDPYSTALQNIPVSDDMRNFYNTYISNLNNVVDRDPDLMTKTYDIKEYAEEGLVR